MADVDVDVPPSPLKLTVEAGEEEDELSAEFVRRDVNIEAVENGVAHDDGKWVLFTLIVLSAQVPWRSIGVCKQISSPLWRDQ